MKEETTGFRLKKWPKELHQRFKAACALRGVGMENRILKLIQQDTEAAERAALREAKGKED